MISLSSRPNTGDTLAKSDGRQAKAVTPGKDKVPRGCFAHYSSVDSDTVDPKNFDIVDRPLQTKPGAPSMPQGVQTHQLLYLAFKKLELK